ncbi:MAG: hypothetical protein QW478_01920 [Candidatus Micrarchaeaceae archaeon]
MNKIVYAKTNNIFIFDGKLKKLINDFVYDTNISVNNQFLIFQDINNIFIFNSLENTITNVELNLRHYLVLAVSESKKFAYAYEDKVYLFDNNTSTLIYTSEKDEIVNNIGWINNNSLLINVETEEDGEEYYINREIQIDTKDVYEYPQFNTSNFIIRDKNIYFYDNYSFYIYNKLTDKVILKSYFHNYALDISYDEKFAVYSTKEKIVFFYFETDEKKEFEIGNIIQIRISLDNKYLLAKNIRNSVKIIDINSETVVDFIYNVNFMCFMPY